MLKRIPYTPLDFAWANWTPEDIRAVAETIVPRKRAYYERIKAVPAGERNFENTLWAAEMAGAEISHDLEVFDLLLHVSPDQEVRNAAKTCFDEAVRRLVDLEYDEGMYRAMKELRDNDLPLGESERKLLEDTLRECRRMGFEAPPETREELKELSKRGREREAAFEKNIQDWEDHIILRSEELAGLPDNFIRGLERNAEGNYKVSINASEYGTFMENSEIAEKRKELMDKRLQKGGARNIAILKEIRDIRAARAKLLGYPSYAAYRIEEQMAKSEERVLSFENDLRDRLRAGAKRELQEVRDAKRRATGNPLAELEYFDIGYYANLLKKEKFRVDDEKTREYFPLPRVFAGMLSIFAGLFELKFEKISGYPAWHPDVELYAIRNMDGSLLAYFFTDFFPRPGKWGHFGAFCIKKGYRLSLAEDDRRYSTPIAGLVGNFSKPGPGRPALIQHSEVETLFHEFGHILHQTLTVAEYPSQSGTSVAIDFVEMPSQIMENWTWSKEVLGLISGHYERPAETLPGEMLDNMIAAKHHLIAYSKTQQLLYGLFDLTLHGSSRREDPVELYNRLYSELTGLEAPGGNIFPAGFGHLVSYAASYYSYMWSEVYAQDLFARFKKEGLMNPKTGAEYRAWILEQGSSRHEMQLIRGFLGREPSSDAFLREIGL